MSRICSLRQVIYYDLFEKICGELNFYTQNSSVRTLYAQAHHQLHSYSHVLTLNILIIKKNYLLNFSPRFESQKIVQSYLFIVGHGHFKKKISKIHDEKI